MRKAKTPENVMKKGIVKLLEIKDSDIRLLSLEQCRDAVDKGIHIGGAFSATIPLTALFYGGFIHLDIEQPTRLGQDMFVLSKGHAVAAMATIYADLGYFDRSVLKNSRSQESLLNGHPGPILSGCHISTGPLGQGMGVAQGFAIVGKNNPYFDVFCMTGDGELQEGPIWETAMYAGYKRLDNFCVLVDRNFGQLDDPRQLILPMSALSEKFMSFGWRVLNVDATQYAPMYEALQTFKFGPRDGRPTVILCNSQKGFGGFSDFMVKHKVNLDDALTEQEMALQNHRREQRVSEFLAWFSALEDPGIREQLLTLAKEMNLDVLPSKDVVPIQVPVKTQRAAARNSKIAYAPDQLPRFEPSQKYSASAVITAAMKVFARDPRVASVDADLSSTSGLETGVGWVDKSRALNVGVAEANMICIGEAFAALGYNTWVSTFCPFFDWKVLRRIAVGYQERLEAIEMENGWLSEGHGLDLTFLATAPNFETTTNGATHMGNDDMLIFGGIAHLKVIDISCPNQLLGAMKWIMEGGKGLVYLRIMRAPSAVLYDEVPDFTFGKGCILQEHNDDRAVIISSGRGVHEALAAAALLEQDGIMAGVVDMPSIDEQLLLELYDSGKHLVIAEQNNGYVWSEFQKILFTSRETIDSTRLLAVNTLDKHGKAQFIHSATYSQLLQRFGLTPELLAERVKNDVEK